MIAELALPRLLTLANYDTVHIKHSLAPVALDDIPCGQLNILGLEAGHGHMKDVSVHTLPVLGGCRGLLLLRLLP